MNNGLPTLTDIHLVLPELVWCAFGVFIMLLQPVLKNRHFFTFLALVGAIGGTAFSVVSAWNYGPGFSGLILSDAFSLFFHLLLGTVAFLVILASESYLERENLDSPEFLALLLFATAGMGVLASAQELPAMSWPAIAANRPNPTNPRSNIFSSVPSPRPSSSMASRSSTAPRTPR